MWRQWVYFALMACVLLVTATSRSDVAPSTTPPPTDLPPETITGEPAVSAPGSETRTAPFRQTDIGPPEAAWPYVSLTDEEKAVVDKGRDVSGWQAIHAGYAEGARARAIEVRAEAAAHQLGVDNLADEGVVP